MANRSTGIYGHFGSFSATNQLPNVAGADVQTSEVQAGDLAAVAGALYICTTATLGAAVWAAVGGSGGSGYAAARGEWYSAASTEAANVVVSDLSSWSRVGSGPGAQSGDVVTLLGRVFLEMQAGAPASFEIDLLFPTDSIPGDDIVVFVSFNGDVSDVNIQANDPRLYAEVTAAEGFGGFTYQVQYVAP